MLMQMLREALQKSFQSTNFNKIRLSVAYPNVDWELLIQNFLKLRNLCITASLMPLFSVLIDILFDNLGANSIQALHIRLGDWSLRFLFITLAITPIQKFTRWPGMSRYRQLFGLFSFFYGTLHVLAYLFIDHALVWRVIGIDIAESSYIWFGLFAYLILFLLAITSSKSAKKWMGKSWKKLHRFIYYATIAAVIHYFWQLKGNLMQPVFYTLLAFLLLVFRLLFWYKNHQFNRLMIPKGRDIED